MIPKQIAVLGLGYAGCVPAASLARMGHRVTGVDTPCRETRPNLSAAYRKPGFALGGSCLPKDLRGLVYRASRLELNPSLLDQIHGSNKSFVLKAISHTGKLTVDSLTELLWWSDAAIMAQETKAHAQTAIPGAGKLLLDLAGAMA